jgi:DNA-binding HxlR family transcriptional regulator
VDYELTALGQTLLDPVPGLVFWAEKNERKIRAARERFDKAAAKTAQPV